MDTQRASQWHRARREAHDEHDDVRGNEDQYLARRADAAQQPSESRSRDYAGADLEERTGEDAGDNASRPRTERGANADLARASRDSE
jgi:hypothetical protein